MKNLYINVMEWKKKHGCDLQLPPSDALIEEVNNKIGPMPEEIKKLYKITNGLKCDWFEILPIEDPNNIKKTWDGVNRENDIKTTKYLNANKALFKKFFVFCSIGGGKCAAYNKSDFTIWYEDEERLNQTNLDLISFVNTMLLEVHNL